LIPKQFNDKTGDLKDKQVRIIIDDEQYEMTHLAEWRGHRP